LRELIFDRIGRGSVCATGHCFDAFFRSELTEGHTPGITAISVSFDGRSVTYGFGELDALVPALCREHPATGHGLPEFQRPHKKAIATFGDRLQLN
jgi:hypothetical protein